MSLAETPEGEGRGFYLYLDEFQNFTTLSLAAMASELYLTQLDLPIQSTILGNAGTIISFRLGMADAEILAKELYPKIAPVELVSLLSYSPYRRLMMDAREFPPLSAET